MPLTHHCIATARPREKLYALTDGHRLHLQVTPEGSKRWRFRYRFAGLENTIFVGGLSQSQPHKGTTPPPGCPGPPRSRHRPQRRTSPGARGQRPHV
jgi:hypothetical protein